jgi:hypothetical protein
MVNEDTPSTLVLGYPWRYSGARPVATLENPNFKNLNQTTRLARYKF